MTRIFCTATIVVMIATVAHAEQRADSGWRRIADAHRSSIDVPIALLRRQRDPASLMFVADDGARVTFETITESRPGFPGNDPEGDMSLGRSNCTTWPPAYRVIKERIAAYSCVNGGAVVYYAARYNGSGSIVLRATYPKSHAAIWDKAVARMSASMRQFARTERWP